jgi:hypothetical protein
MIHRSVVVVLSFVASVALAGNDGRTPGAKGPVAVVSAASVAQPADSMPAGSPGAPLDRTPLPSYPPVPSGPPQTISGQCFVVTDGGQKITLSRVDVCVYSQRQFEGYAREVDARSRARFAALKSIACPENFAALSVSEMDRSLAVAEALQHDLYVVWQILPAAAASAQTDADGRFSVTHRVAPPYVVFAVGQRTFGSETEYYRWQIPSSAIRNPSQVDLTNDRLR